MSSEPVLLIDNPIERVQRLTLNRPDKRNALDDELRQTLFEELRKGDKDPDVSVILIRGCRAGFLRWIRPLQTEQ